MKFKTIYVKEKSDFFTPNGDRYHKKLQLKILPSGKHEFIEVSVDDQYAEIQTYYNSTDIHWILDHFVNNPTGLEAKLQKVTGQYIDLTAFPSNYHELVQRVVDSKFFFNSLPKEIREKFDNDINVFMVKLGTDESNKIFEEYSKNFKFKEEQDSSSGKSDVVE